MAAVQSLNVSRTNPYSPWSSEAGSTTHANLAGFGFDRNSIASMGGVLQQNFLGEPLWFYAGLIAILGAWKFIGEHENSNINPAHLHIGGYNLVGVTVTAIVGIVLLKMLVNRWQVPGLTQLINAV
jgi:hypothetical protein